MLSTSVIPVMFTLKKYEPSYWHNWLQLNWILIMISQRKKRKHFFADTIDIVSVTRNENGKKKEINSSVCVCVGSNSLTGKSSEDCIFNCLFFIWHSIHSFIIWWFLFDNFAFLIWNINILVCNCITGYSAVVWGCWRSRLHLCWEVRSHERYDMRGKTSRTIWYDAKPS